jgi:hypothetical protein
MFHWSVREIDETDIESLIPFVFRYPQWKESLKAKPSQKAAYADQINI